MKKSILATFTVPGFHHWKGAPQDFAYLRNSHRHLFHVRAEKVVSQGDREIEFIKFGAYIRAWLLTAFPSDEIGSCEFGGRSCEDIAGNILSQFYLSKCTVLEDNENGAIVQTEEE